MDRIKQYCVNCKEDTDLIVIFEHYSHLEGKQFGICYECINDYKGARD